MVQEPTSIFSPEERAALEFIGLNPTEVLERGELPYTTVWSAVLLCLDGQSKKVLGFFEKLRVQQHISDEELEILSEYFTPKKLFESHLRFGLSKSAQTLDEIVKRLNFTAPDLASQWQVLQHFDDEIVEHLKALLSMGAMNLKK